MPKNHKLLDALVDNKTIANYELLTINADGEIETIADENVSRNTERLIITFNNGEKLTIDTFCSGSNENTHLIISKE